MCYEEVTHFFRAALDVEVKLREGGKPDLVEAEHKVQILLKGMDDANNEGVGVRCHGWWVLGVEIGEGG